MTVRAVQRGAPRAWEGRCHGGRREREGEEIAMNVNMREEIAMNVNVRGRR